MSDELKKKAVINEAMTITPACPNGQLYTVRPGDTMSQIARNSRISLQTLISANPQIPNPNVIYPGQRICIPVGPGPGPGPQCPGGRVYRVVAGDTMTAIANRYGVTLDALIQANPQVANPDLIFPGQEICIPPGGGTVPCTTGALYTVRSGDTLFEIARRNGLALSTLVAANPQITDPDRIFPGQVICLPRAGAIQPPPVFPEPPMFPEPPVMPPVAPPAIPPFMPEPPAVMPPVMPPMPCPPSPLPLPTPVPPMPMPTEPPMPLPLPTPVPPMPLPTPVLPGQSPCPPGMGEMPSMYQPMPVYVVVPWEECPYRPKKKTKHDHKRRCCR